MSELIISGDDHIIEKEPFFSAKRDYFNWYSAQYFNNPNNYALFLGDLFDKSLPSPNEYKLAINFINSLKFKKIIILGGNHCYCRSRNSYSINVFKEFENIVVITDHQEITIESLKCYLLPYIYPKVNKSIKDIYEALELEEEFDYVFGHLSNVPLFGEEIDISHIKGKKVMGHVHIIKDDFLGVPVITRYDERGQDCKLLSIDLFSKEETIINVPKFIDYYSLEYPNDPETVDALYPIWDILNCPVDTNIVWEKYKNLFIRRIEKQKDTEYYEELETDNSSSKTIQEHLIEYIKLKKPNKQVKEKLMELVK